MTNANPIGRPSEAAATRPEPAATRPEPKEPRPEPRSTSTRAGETKATEARPVELRAPETRASEPVSRPSVLGSTLRFRGELSAQEDLIIQGSVEGSVTHSQSLTIGTDGTMIGSIRARTIIIDGKVEGDLVGAESVTIRATAKVKGNVFAPRVSIQDGAFFQGQVDMQPTAAVQEHGGRLRSVMTAEPALPESSVERMLSGT